MDELHFQLKAVRFHRDPRKLASTVGPGRVCTDHVMSSVVPSPATHAACGATVDKSVDVSLS